MSSGIVWDVWAGETLLATYDVDSADEALEAWNADRGSFRGARADRVTSFNRSRISREQMLSRPQFSRLLARLEASGGSELMLADSVLRAFESDGETYYALEPQL